MKRLMIVLTLIAGMWFAPIPALCKNVAAQPAGDKGLAAIERAASAKKYLFVFFFKAEDKNTVQKVVDFFKAEDENTRNMRKIFETTMNKVKDRADSIAINVTDPSEKGIVNKLKVKDAPMPLVLALAPNGAVTGGFPAPFDQNTLLNAFASPTQEKTLKALQDGKLVLLCVQNIATKSNNAAMQGVRDFKNDTKYAQSTEIITLNPMDGKEADFLKIWDISSKPQEAVTLFIIPPGSTIGKFVGATDKKSLETTLQAALSTGSKCCPSSGGSASKNCAPK